MVEKCGRELATAQPGPNDLTPGPFPAAGRGALARRDWLAVTAFDGSLTPAPLFRMTVVSQNREIVISEKWGRFYRCHVWRSTLYTLAISGDASAYLTEIFWYLEG